MVYYLLPIGFLVLTIVWPLWTATLGWEMFQYCALVEVLLLIVLGACEFPLFMRQESQFLITEAVCVVIPLAVGARLAWVRSHPANPCDADPRVVSRFCESCGYDLTGNVSGVCPECGTKIAEATE